MDRIGRSYCGPFSSIRHSARLRLSRCGSVREWECESVLVCWQRYGGGQIRYNDTIMIQIQIRYVTVQAGTSFPSTCQPQRKHQALRAGCRLQIAVDHSEDWGKGRRTSRFCCNFITCITDKAILQNILLVSWSSSSYHTRPPFLVMMVITVLVYWFPYLSHQSIPIHTPLSMFSSNYMVYTRVRREAQLEGMCESMEK